MDTALFKAREVIKQSLGARRVKPIYLAHHFMGWSAIQETGDDSARLYIGIVCGDTIARVGTSMVFHNTYDPDTGTVEVYATEAAEKCRDRYACEWASKGGLFSMNPTLASKCHLLALQPADVALIVAHLGPIPLHMALRCNLTVYGLEDIVVSRATDNVLDACLHAQLHSINTNIHQAGLELQHSLKLIVQNTVAEIAGPVTVPDTRRFTGDSDVHEVQQWFRSRMAIAIGMYDPAENQRRTLTDLVTLCVHGIVSLVSRSNPLISALCYSPEVKDSNGSWLYTIPGYSVYSSLHSAREKPDAPI